LQVDEVQDNIRTHPKMREAIKIKGSYSWGF